MRFWDGFYRNKSPFHNWQGTHHRIEFENGEIKGKHKELIRYLVQNAGLNKRSGITFLGNELDIGRTRGNLFYHNEGMGGRFTGQTEGIEDTVDYLCERFTNLYYSLERKHGITDADLKDKDLEEAIEEKQRMAEELREKQRQDKILHKETLGNSYEDEEYLIWKAEVDKRRRFEERYKQEELNRGH